MHLLMCAWKDRAHPLAGGAERWTWGVCRALAERGVDVTLATSAAPGRPAEECDGGIRIVRGGDYRHGVHRHVRTVYAREAGAFDVVVDQINTRPFAAPCWATSSRVVAMAHQVAREVWSSEVPWPVAVLGRYVLEPRWLRGYADVDTFTVSASSARSLGAYGLHRVHVLPQGADLPAPVSAPVAKDASPTFAFVGRLTPCKRADHAIEAFRAARASLPGARLWVMGTGPAEAKLRARPADGVEFLGHVDEATKRDRLARSHALLVTSVREGWGLVVSEAAAVGTRTIGYAVDGLVDSVPAAGGLLVEPRPGALARAMVEATAGLVAMGPPASHGTVGWGEVADAFLDGLDGLDAWAAGPIGRRRR